MLYADDAAVVSLSADGLQQLMDVFVAVTSAFGLTVSTSKTETMRQAARSEAAPDSR